MKPYRILVTGSRDWTDAALIDKALQAECLVAVGERRPLVVVHGGAKGADAMANQWAYRNLIPIEQHPAVWRPRGVYNPQAGLLRNRQMVKLGADVCLAFIRSGSRGATHCALLAEEAGIPVKRYLADTPMPRLPDDVPPRWRVDDLPGDI